MIDVGAHVGTWAQHLAQTCRRVHAFEPQRQTFERLREGARLAGLTNIECHDVALGERGEVDLHVVSVDGGGSTLRHRPQLPPVIAVERVRAAQLDDYTFENVGLIKIDAEGAEGAILRGAIKTITTHRPTLVLEAWNHDWYACDRAELIALVESLNYRIQELPGWPETLVAEPLAPTTHVNPTKLFQEIEKIVHEGGEWCTAEKATVLASLVVSLRPRVVVELGVWMGGSAIPMAMALKAVNYGQLIAIDAWAPEASVAGQDDLNARWWGETVAAAGHERAYQDFVARLQKHAIGERCVVRRQATDRADVPPRIDILHHDANHGPQAVLDIERWAPAVRIGGLLVIDDLNWGGGHVVRARDRARELGFVELYALGTGCVMQRTRMADMPVR